MSEQDTEGRIAIIGMAGRFPGAADLAAFADRLRHGVESMRRLTPDELAAGGESRSRLADPAYVPVAAPLEDIDQFDAAFFGMSPRDAAIFDPQHRLLLECAWEAFERAGHGNGIDDAIVGVFTSCGASEYMYRHVLANAEVTEQVGEWLIRHLGNDPSFLATRISYQLGLTGPSMNVQTACSSTLVAVHLACQSILSGECDMALAGGAVVAPDQLRGYVYQEGEILSPDGHCRPFDAAAAGTVISSAAACVVLRPLDAALEAGDTVLAVIRGSAINNDGNDKVGYLAPSVSGQSRVVSEALALSGVDPRDVSYVEAHGTGTLLGDPIEVAALTQAYRAGTDDVGYCALGSLKSNIGHTGEAAGVSALIKTVLALQHRELFPTLHFTHPNPRTELEGSPFYVHADLRPWSVGPGRTRIAGVTGLGAGGTNAHVIVEEAPPAPRSTPSSRPQLITVSGRSEATLAEARDHLAEHLRSTDDALADVAWTRLVGRAAFVERCAVVATSAAGAAAALAGERPRLTVTGRAGSSAPGVVFMCPGGGAQYAAMGHGLYTSEPVFRDAVDRCCAIVRHQLDVDLHDVLYPTGDRSLADKRLENPAYALPALFTTTYAVAMLLESWGVTPTAMVGHSAGEYVVACLSGVLTLEDALRMVTLRGRLFETLPEGGMLSVSLAEHEVRPLLPAGLDIGVINGPELCVVSGPRELIDAAQRLLDERGIQTARVHIDVAAHSSMLEPIIPEFRRFCAGIRFGEPTIPYVSNLTGTWVTAADVADPEYWVRHLRSTVRFGEGLSTVLSAGERVTVEIGPGRTLTGLVGANPVAAVASTSVLRHPSEDVADAEVAVLALGRLWCAGVPLDAEALFAGEVRRRVVLPTYPFERRRHWIDADPDARGLHRRPSSGRLERRPETDSWFEVPVWVPTPLAAPGALDGVTVVVGDSGAFPDDLGRACSALGSTVVRVAAGRRPMRWRPDVVLTDPTDPERWSELLGGLEHRHGRVARVVVVATADPPTRRRPGADVLGALDDTTARDFAALSALGTALARGASVGELVVVTAGVHDIGADEPRRPDRALLHGVIRVAGRECAGLASRAIDVPATPTVRRAAAVAAAVAAELTGAAVDDVVVLDAARRWRRGRQPVDLRPSADASSPWQPGTHVLITGGTGALGLSVAEHVASVAPGAAITLVGRTPVPPAHQWDELLATTDDEVLRQRLAALVRCREAGARVLTLAADVADEASFERSVADAEGRRGRIRVVLHAAGVLSDVLLAVRDPRTQAAVVASKARGAAVIDSVFAGRDLDLLVLFGSVASWLGLPGQSDYTAANAYLDAFAGWRSAHRGGRTVSVDWNAWQGSGMAEAAARRQASGPERSTVATAAPAAELFDEVSRAGSVIEGRTDWSAGRHWVIAEHVIAGGDHVMPGTGYVELLRSIGAEAWGAAPMVITDLVFLSPFAVARGSRRSLHVRLDVETGSAVVHSGEVDAPHATATVRPAAADEPAGSAAIDLNAARERCTTCVVDTGGRLDQSFMDFGPRWHNVRRQAFGAAEAVLDLELAADLPVESDSLWLHPALLDMATGGAQALIPEFDPTECFLVPFGYGRLLARAPLPTAVVSLVRLRPGSSTETAVFDVTVCAPGGEVLVEVEAFTMRRVPSLPGGGRPTLQLGTPGADAATDQPDSLRAGMTVAEGVGALDRVLASGIVPQVVASSIDVTSWLELVDREAAGPGAAAAAGAGDEAGALDGAGPDTADDPLLAQLAGFWAELLGVSRIRPDDDFFDLGGQSLIAIRLMSRIQRTLGIRLQLADIFAMPTLTTLAAGIRERDPSIAASTAERGADATAAHAPWSPSDQPPRRGCLVPVSTTGAEAPLYVVHGAGGNVLFLWSLARSLAGVRPVYGFQAAGIEYGTEPDATIEAMAERYVAELVADHSGPYLLGGYSGGGLIALEMANRLQELGHEVDHVILLDIPPPEARPRSNRARLLNLAQNVRRHGIVACWPYISGKLSRNVSKVRSSVRTASGHGAERLPESDETTQFVDLTEHFTRIAERFETGTYAVRVSLIMADRTWPEMPEGYGWPARIEGRFVARRVRGDHWNMVDPAMGDVLGEAVAELLSDG
jgi:acyl transferase domain-containing protein/thioesterase domain-containing protein/acyl carrier protein